MARLIMMGSLVGLVMLAGCASTSTSDTARTAQEQLLISNSIDQSLNKVDFNAFQGAKVFIDETYLDCVDKKYLVGSVRHRVLRSGASVVEKADAADLIVEVRSGGVGTNNADMFIGTPKLALPGPIPISLPEVRLLSKKSQTGIAKIGIVAYNAKTRQMLGDGGMSLAQSDDSNWYVMGMGPYQNGSVMSEVSNGLSTPPAAYQPLPYNVAFDESPKGVPGAPASDRVQWADSTEENAPGNRVQPASN